MQADRTFRVEYMAGGGDWGHTIIRAATPVAAEQTVLGWDRIHPQKRVHASHERIGSEWTRIANHPI